MTPIHWNILKPSLETLVVPVLLSEYDTNHFGNLSVFKILKTSNYSNSFIDFKGFTKFMKNHQEAVKDLSFHATGPQRKQIELLLPYLSMVKKLEITVEDCDIMTILTKNLRKYALSLEHLSFRFKYSLKNNLFKQLPDEVDNITIKSDKDRDKLTTLLVEQILSGNPMKITLEELCIPTEGGWSEHDSSEYLDSLKKHQEAASITVTNIRYIDEPCCGCGTRNNHVFQVCDIQITRKA